MCIYILINIYINIDRWIDRYLPADDEADGGDLVCFVEDAAGVRQLSLLCQLCGKVAEMTLGQDFTHTIVNLSVFQLPVAVRTSTEPDRGSPRSLAA